MNWKIYTKRIVDDHSTVLRWFWRKPVTEGRTESSQSFVTRAECEDDAARQGYTKDALPDPENLGAGEVE